MRKNRYRKNKKKGKVSEAVQKYVKRTIHSNIENKYYQNAFTFGTAPNPVNPLNMRFTTAMLSTAGISTTNGLFPLNIMAQGDDVNSRTGDVIRVMSVKVRITLAAVVNASGLLSNIDPIYARILLIHTKSPEGLPPFSADFITATAVTEIDNPILPNVDATHKILSDKTYFIQNQGNINNNPLLKTINLSYRFKNPLKCVFYPTSVQAAAAQDWRTIKTNGLSVVVIAGPAGGGFNCHCFFYSY